MQTITGNNFFHNHVVQWLVILIVFLNAISWIGLFVSIPRTEDPVLLHYNAYIGLELDSIGPWYTVYWVPGFSLLFSLGHIITSYIFFRRRERIISHVILLSAVLVQIAVVIASASIILVNRI